ncbi:hypothetical protein IFM89_039184 [Coptis chinensis]|uniref:Uncharacterized protein n=1 Tax=Coptis chinensis TaxID=261450 RepID=A0A835LDS5_9MAGN|nr:hypothetical protein IFM89_039184 [Coptis chinensis]
MKESREPGCMPVSSDQVEWHKICLLAYVEILIPPHNNLLLPCRRIRRNFNRQPYLTETTISGYWYAVTAHAKQKDWGLSGVMLRGRCAT